MERKISIIIFFACMLISGVLSAQNSGKRDHKVVMQVTAGDSLSQASVVAQVRNIKKILRDAEIEVVCHSDGLEMLMRSKSKVPAVFEEMKSQGVRFVACENSMARKKITVQDLCPGVSTVPSAMVEMILKQEDGWSYVKGGH